MSYAVMPMADYKAVCDKVREKTNTTEVIKSGEMAEKVEEVYKAGQLSVFSSSEALKGEAEGNPISITDVSPVEHDVSVKVSGDAITDFSGVKVTVGGKNLFDKTAPKYSGVYVDVLNGEDFVVTTKNANQYISANFVIPNGDALVGKTLTVCGEWEVSGTNKGGLRVLWTSATNPNLAIGKGGAFATISGIPSTKIVPEKPDGAGELCLFIYGNTTGTSAVGDTVTYKNIQVEIGETATEYEPYIEPTEYTANADGTVEGIKSKYPSMSFTTDTEGVNISVEYYKDIDKVLQNLAINTALSGGE